MAIKVIKHGEKTFKVVCSVCGCEFEYEYEDLVDSYLPGIKQIKCPDCGKQIHVFQEEISSNIVFKHFNDRNRGNSNSIC